ncbi:hypothetical protein BH20ACT23_BH20ACT23_05210 [soil metagenome]
MGKLIYSMITSLDGYVSDPDGNFGWGAPEGKTRRVSPGGSRWSPGTPTSMTKQPRPTRRSTTGRTTAGSNISAAESSYLAATRSSK